MIEKNGNSSYLLRDAALRLAAALFTTRLAAAFFAARLRFRLAASLAATAALRAAFLFRVRAAFLAASERFCFADTMINSSLSSMLYGESHTLLRQ